MLFETDIKKPTNTNGNTFRNTTQKPAGVAKPAGYNNINRPAYKPTQNNISAYSKPVPKAVVPPPVKKPVPANTYMYKGYPRVIPTPIRKPVAPAYKPVSKKPVTSPYKPIVRKPVTALNSIQPRKVYRYPVAIKPIPATVVKNYNRIMKPVPHYGSQTGSSRRIYRGPMVVRRGMNIPGRRSVSPGTLQSAAGAASPSVNTKINVNAPGRYVPGYGYCTPMTSAPVAQAPPQSTPVTAPTSAPKPTCHTCGKKISGCTTLSRFAFNSAHLTAAHQSQIRNIAINILKQPANAVIITGHTDKSGKENYNQVLGIRRAGTVLRALKKQLAILKPNGQKDIFFKVRSRGETQPISKTDVAVNRRVHICVRKLKPA